MYTNEEQKELETLRELIKDIETAMLTTQTAEGLLSRPMKTQEVEFDGDVWFFTKKNTDKYTEILQNPSVNVAYAGKAFVSMRGKAEIVEDVSKKKELWSKMYEKLLQTDYQDPDLILIKVNVEAAEYWETDSMVKNIVKLYKRMTGKGSDTEDLNETIELDH